MILSLDRLVHKGRFALLLQHITFPASWKSLVTSMLTSVGGPHTAVAYHDYLVCFKLAGGITLETKKPGF